MAAPDWFTDCSKLVLPHICRIASVVGPLLLAAGLWCFNRIEAKTDYMQAVLQQIQIDVAVLRGFRDAPPSAPAPGFAMADEGRE